MGSITCTYTSCSVAVRVVSALADLDVGHTVVNGGGLTGGQPILRVRVSITEPVTRQTRHGVIQMRNPVLIALLLRDVTGKLLVADAW